jgi:hypothetical protein
VVLWRLCYRLTLRDLTEMFLQRGFVFSHEAARAWEAKLAPVLMQQLRRRRCGKGGARGRRWHVDETYLKVGGPWTYLYRAIDHDGNLASARRFCRSYDELRSFRRFQTRHNQHGTVDRHRLLHLHRATTALAIFQVA